MCCNASASGKVLIFSDIIIWSTTICVLCYNQVQNPAGGFVNKISDLQRFQRFVIIGAEGGTFYTKQNELENQNLACLERLVIS